MLSRQAKVLIVDDMRAMRGIVRKGLRSLGLENITEAEDGSAAWTEFQQAATAKEPFSLVVSDWNMPRMTGIDLLRHIRSHPEVGNTPVVLLTAENEKAQIIQAIELKVNAYIMKPFTFETFHQKLAGIFSAKSSKSA